ncbi:MAG: CxxC-x17-CxxC domain-containing protein [Patescibacteria group bacterium]
MADFKKNKFSKDSRPHGAHGARDFSRGGSSRPSFGGSAPRYGARDNGPTESFKTTCSKCSKACEVPFKPNGKKPVFCRDCFVRDDAPRTNDSRYEKRSYGPDRAPEQRSYAPAPTAAPDPRIAAIQKELSVVHTKLDTLIESLQGTVYASILAKSAEREEKSTKAVVAKPKVAKKKVAAPAKAKKVTKKK